MSDFPSNIVVENKSFSELSDFPDVFTGMKTVDSATPTPVILFKALANSKRVTILRYLNSCSYATNKVICKNTQIDQPQVSDAMKRLLKANLITQEKVGTQKIFMLNRPVWQTVEHLLH
ncbi:MAG: ArsR family transcriptional regulator [Sphingobacteriales bacterium]|nr:MAG: ArsR family transcriptional regulator [Sphingobacteriales bacterium]